MMKPDNRFNPLSPREAALSNPDKREGDTMWRVSLQVISTALAISSAPGWAIESEDFSPREISHYPYTAPVEREAQIRTGFGRIKIGMIPREVVAILGPPDEVVELYGTEIKSAVLIGHTFWYVIRRDKKSGSVDERNESLVRISFDLDSRVTGVDDWGLDM